MPKASLQPNEHGGESVWIFCPGCNSYHSTIITATEAGLPMWTWNQNTELPTIKPSILVTWGGNGRICHSFVTDGKIQFLGDCSHSLKNQTVDLPEVDL